ncbi:MAG: hypothetical protein AMS24_04280 [Chlamydiae bacterium SM23_39]|nr:MAG: hypothetical protein AMS24_04280 [Chlamydiae bacterium SM23_39]
MITYAIMINSNEKLHVPKEIFWEISKFLYTKDIIALASICKAYYNEVKNKNFWKEQLNKYNFEYLQSRSKINLKSFEDPKILVLILDLIMQIDNKNDKDAINKNTNHIIKKYLKKLKMKNFFHDYLRDHYSELIAKKYFNQNDIKNELKNNDTWNKSFIIGKCITTLIENGDIEDALEISRLAPTITQTIITFSN